METRTIETTEAADEHPVQEPQKVDLALPLVNIMRVVAEGSNRHAGTAVWRRPNTQEINC